jgi:hypothetical protein
MMTSAGLSLGKGRTIYIGDKSGGKSSLPEISESPEALPFLLPFQYDAGEAVCPMTMAQF